MKTTNKTSNKNRETEKKSNVGKMPRERTLKRIQIGLKEVQECKDTGEGEGQSVERTE